MAIILPQDHPAFSRLQSQNIPVRAEAANSDPAAADKAVTMGVIHKNNAARRKSRLVKKLNSLQ